MKRSTFLAFVAPSVAVMLLLIAVPLIGVIWLAVHQSFTRTELVEVTTEVPLFGGLTRTTTRVVPQSVIGEDGLPETVTRFVGAANFRDTADPEALAAALNAPTWKQVWSRAMNIDFWSALLFTLLYVVATTPAVLILGLMVALGVNRVTRRLQPWAVFVTILPMAITPVVSSLAIYWLFMDGALVPAMLQWLGLGRHYFLGDAITVRTIIILHGIWYAAPFAFVIYYAGLQTVPREPLEAALVDGANAWERLRFVILPHLAPLTAIIALVHVMDAYRIFEPILVFGSAVYANSVQYQTFWTLTFEDNANKAAAYAVLTLLGVLVIMAPVLWRTSRDLRGAS
jgi:multiple sugar transport system permease protein